MAKFHKDTTSHQEWKTKLFHKIKKGC